MKEIQYTYDRQGNITQKEYRDLGNSLRNLTCTYEYDAAGRLAQVKTTHSGVSNKTDAQYTLFSTGQPKRLVLGDPKAQGVDYRYNTRDWLIHINHHNLAQSAPSQDNNDRFGMQIGYDVKALIGSQQNMPQNWNGNVSWFAYRISGVTVPGTGNQRVGYAFWYDKANRLEKANFGFFNTSWQTTDRYNVRDILYHKNGNITALKRYNQSGNLLHNYTYNYYENTNRLRRVTGSGNNYDYDHKGNMIQDLANGIGFVIYDIHNLPVRVFTTDGAPRDYAYDHNGNRVRKYNGIETNYYINGIDGRTEVVTDKASSWATYNLYGLDQIGQILRIGTTWNRYYFLKDHLGNVKVIVDASGNRIAHTDMYPFGFEMPGRVHDSSSVDGRYKFTGKERDTETKYDYFGARYYDARVGRWLQVDPMAEKYPGWSPYVYVHNSPLKYIDPTGEQVISIYGTARGMFTFGGSISYGIAFDLQGNVGFVRRFGFKGGLGLGLSAGINISVIPTADSIKDIEGGGASIGGFLAYKARILEVTGDIYFKNGNGNLDWGATYGAIPLPGVGIAIGLFGEYSHTDILYSTSLNEISELISENEQVKIWLGEHFEGDINMLIDTIHQQLARYRNDDDLNEDNARR